MEADKARRGFLTGSWLHKEGRQQLVQPQSPLGPEPPKIARHINRALCKSCVGRCLSVCETGVIRLYPEGHSLAGAPWLDFSVAPCIFCGKCADACPHIELLSVDEERVVIGVAEISHTRCLSYTSVFCISCQSSCGYQAIQRDRLSRPQIRPDACTGCGACVSICPVQAISVHCDRGGSERG